MSAPTQVLGTIHELAAEAQTTPQMMRALWRLAADATKNMQKGVSNILCAKVQHLVEYKIYLYSSINRLMNKLLLFLLLQPHTPGFSHRPLSRHGTQIIRPKVSQQINGPLRRLQGRL
jgi:hypothetical protein